MNKAEIRNKHETVTHFMDYLTCSIHPIVFNVLAKSLLFDGPLKVIWFTVAIVRLWYYYLLQTLCFRFEFSIRQYWNCVKHGRNIERMESNPPWMLIFSIKVILIDDTLQYDNIKWNGIQLYFIIYKNNADKRWNWNCFDSRFVC